MNRPWIFSTPGMSDKQEVKILCGNLCDDALAEGSYAGENQCGKEIIVEILVAEAV